MRPPVFPVNETDRLASLCQLNILDTDPEEGFDRITRIAASHFKVPIALVSLVDSDRQWFKSTQGLDASETSRDISFCGHAILGQDIFYIPDTLEDERFFDNPLVTDSPNIRFYAGAPLSLPNGTKMGTLCIIDRFPRTVSDEDLRVLRDLADCVEQELIRTSLVKLTDQLRTSEERLQRSQDFSDIGIWDWNIKTGEAFWSDKLIEHFGFEKDVKHTFDNFISAIHPEDRQIVLDAFDHGVKYGEKFDCEYRVARPDGSIHWLHGIGDVLSAENGRSLLMSGSSHDITERKFQEEKISLNKQLLDVLHKAQSKFIMQQDPTVAFKGLLTEILDITASEYGFIGEILHTRENAPFLKLYAATNNEKDPQTRQFYDDIAPTGLNFHDMDNLFGWIATSGEMLISNDPDRHPKNTGLPENHPDFKAFLGVPFHHGKKLIGLLALANRPGGYDQSLVDFLRPLISASSNIIQAVRTEQTLRDREARISAILNNVVDGIVTIDKLGVIETFNPAAERLFGYNADEVIGLNVKCLMPEPYRNEHDRFLQNYRDTGEAKIIGSGREVVGQRKDFSTFPMELAVGEMEVAGNQMFTGIVRDISERKQAERMKTEFISTVSHELRTPLTSIKGSLGLIQSGAIGELPDKLSSMLSIAYNNSDRLIRLINDILDTEKIGAGMMDFRIAPMDLGLLLEQAIEANKGYGERHGVNFVLSSELTEARVEGDHDRLMQVLANLMSNAVKFSPEGGNVELSLSRQDGNFRVAVSDRGSGIPEDFRDKVFGRFHQADSSDSRKKGGSGLGLNITRAIVEHHGGTIYFETESDKGTTFFVDLPVLQEPLLTLAPFTTGIAQYHVLICEDEPDIAKLLDLMLKQDGFTTDIARNAAEAEAMLDKNTYDAMTLDLGLPDKDGITFLQELRNNPETRALPIIVISAKAAEGARELNGDAIGVIDWLVKPVDQERLSDGLRRAVAHSPDGKARILHVEDDPDVLLVVSTLISGLAEIVPAKTLSKAKTLLAQHTFDLVILDLTLQDGDGKDLLPLLKNDSHKSTPVIVFSAQDISGEAAGNIKATLVKSKTSNEALLAIIRSSIEARISGNGCSK